MGDTHFYNYGSDCTDVRFYPRSKFVSEFGTQSYPSFSVLQNVTSPSDWSYTSDMSNYRCATQLAHLSVCACWELASCPCKAVGQSAPTCCLCILRFHSHWGGRLHSELWCEQCWCTG